MKISKRNLRRLIISVINEQADMPQMIPAGSNTMDADEREAQRAEYETDVLRVKKFGEKAAFARVYDLLDKEQRYGADLRLTAGIQGVLDCAATPKEAKYNNDYSYISTPEDYSDSPGEFPTDGILDRVGYMSRDLQNAMSDFIMFEEFNELIDGVLKEKFLLPIFAPLKELKVINQNKSQENYSKEKITIPDQNVIDRAFIKMVAAAKKFKFKKFAT